MSRFFLGLLTPIALILLLILGLWICDLTGLAKINNLALNMVSFLPGLKDLKEDYELGKKRSEVLQEKEDALHTWESQLKANKKRLDKQVSSFESEKMKWETKNISKELGNGDVSSKQIPQGAQVELKEDPEFKKYVAMVGGMKPDKAAAVLQKLPESTAYLILKKQRPAQASKVLDKLPADYVARMTQQRLPGQPMQ